MAFTSAAEANPHAAAISALVRLSTPVVNAELGLQAVGGFLVAGELQHQRMHLEFDALHLFRRHALGFELRAGVNAGVDHDAACKRLVTVEGNLEALAQLVGDLAPVDRMRSGLINCEIDLARSVE